MRRAVPVLALLLWLCGACGGQSAGRGQAVSDHATVRIECNIADAELWINDRFLGLVGTLAGGISLTPGQHRIEIRHTQYHAYYQELRADARQRIAIDAVLVPVLR